MNTIGWLKGLRVTAGRDRLTGGPKAMRIFARRERPHLASHTRVHVTAPLGVRAGQAAGLRMTLV